MNQYINIIRDLSLKNQQTDDYIRLCENALLRVSTDTYIEKHHILPKCICDIAEQKLDKENLVIFTAREHFEAHRLLSEMFTGKINRKMLYALSGLCFKKDGGRILNADEYAIVKEASRIAKRGIPLSEEHKQKIRDKFAEFNPNKGRCVSEETRKKQSIMKIGKAHYHSDETRRKLGESRIGLVISDVRCPHCEKTGKPGAMGRWHFSNCKDLVNI